MSKFKRGDLVKLKSGGPVMTVISVFTEEDKTEQTSIILKALRDNYPGCESFASCSWFDESKELKQEYFPEDTIEVYNKE